LTSTDSGLGSGGSTIGWYVTGTSPAASGAIRSNACSLRSTCPAWHGGHWSTTSAVTDPSGPVTSMKLPHAADPSYSPGDSATNRPPFGSPG
jgi:hypothetical protein